MTIKLYKYTGATININKSPLLGTPLTITDSHVAGNQDMENPILVISGTGTNAALDYNYCYIQDWSRYYFIVKRTWLADSVYQIQLEEDYIYTAQALILAQNGLCRYSGLGDGNLTDNRVILKPYAHIDKYNVQSFSENADRNIFVMHFYSSNPVIASEIPSPYLGNIGLNEAVVYLSDQSLEAFFRNYANLSEADRVAVGKAIISINFVQAPGLITSNAISVTKLKFETPFSNSPIEVSCYPTGGHYAKVIPSPTDIRNCIDPELFKVIATTDTPKVFNTENKFYFLNGIFTLKMGGLQPINISPRSFGKNSSFTISFNLMYEPFTEQHIINLFPDVYDGEYTPIIQKCTLSMPFMSDTSFDQFGLNSLANSINLVSGVGGGLIRSGTAIGSGDVMGTVSSSLGIANSIVGYVGQQERMELGENIGYSVSGSPGIAMFYAKSMPISWNLYHAFYEPVSLPWDHKGIPDGHWRSLLSLSGTGYAEIDLVDITGNNGIYSDNEIQQIIQRLAAGVIFNATP